MRYTFNPAAPIMKQMRFMCLPEHLPINEAIVYRFFDTDNTVLYIGVTVSPRGRWQRHKNTAEWWSRVRAVSVEHYPHERAALDAEVAAIKAERPPFNRRSVPANLVRDSCAAHESRLQASDAFPPRVGGGVGGRGDDAHMHASYLTDGAVDNRPASATAAPGPQVACSAFGGSGRWSS